MASINENQKKRLSYLKARNQFRLNSPKYIKPLEQDIFLSSEYSYIVQPELEELLAHIREIGLDQKYTCRYHVDDVKEVEFVMSSLNVFLRTENYFSIDSLDHYWFAKVNTEFAITKFKEVLNIDGDGFCIYDLDFRNGLRLDIYQQNYWVNEKTVYGLGYEIDIWGEVWIEKFFEGKMN